MIVDAPSRGPTTAAPDTPGGDAHRSATTTMSPSMATARPKFAEIQPIDGAKVVSKVIAGVGSSTTV